MKSYQKCLIVQIAFSKICNKLQFRNIDIPFIVEETSNLIGIDNQKQYYKVSNSQNTPLGILRPEMTYIATKLVNEHIDRVYYYGYCFRKERTQYLRYNEFQQLGIELININFTKHTIDVVVCFIHLKLFLNWLKNDTYKLIVNINEQSDYIEDIKKMITNNFINIEFNSIKREGGEATYTFIAFEIHMFSDEKQKYYEALGGGCYSVTKTKITSNGVGYACGIERIVELNNISTNEMLETQTNIMNVCILIKEKIDYDYIYTQIYTMTQDCYNINLSYTKSFEKAKRYDKMINSCAL